MKKWIKTHFGNDLVELKEIVVVITYHSEEDNETIYYLECNQHYLGSYDTYERCIEILNQIEQFLSTDTVVFVMPDE